MSDLDGLRRSVLDAALPNVAFDGWSDETLKAALRDADVDPALHRDLFPRGGVDLALAYHHLGDTLMLERMAQADFAGLRFRDKIAMAVRLRIEAIDDKEAVRRGAALFALPIYAADGAKAIWGTADKIWTALGDTSEDVNWYTKRATLSAVYGSTVLYWLGDESAGAARSWAFLDRRIDGVMQFEKLKGQVQDNPVLRGLFAGPSWLMSQVRAPKQQASGATAGLPGRWVPPPNR